MTPAPALAGEPTTSKPGVRRNLTLLFAGQFVSKAGDQLAGIAFVWLVITLTGSAASLGAVMTALTISGVLFRVFSGPVVDRFDKTTLLIAADVFRALLVLVLAFLVWQGRCSMAALLLIAAGLGLGDALFSPALSALAPRIVSGDRLLRFNATYNAINQAAGIVVPSAAGILIAVTGVATALVADAVSFGVSATSLAFLRLDRRPSQSRGSQSTGSTLRSELLEGVRYAISNPLICAIFVAVGILNFADAMVVVYPVHIRQVLGGGVLWYGFLNGAVMCGLFCANALNAIAFRRINPKHALVVGAAIEGCGVVMFAGCPNLWLTLPAMFLFGAGMGAFGTAAITLLQRHASSNLLGRMFSLYGIFALSSMPLGYAAGGAMAALIGTTATLALAGAIMVGLAIAAAVGPLSLEAARRTPRRPPGETSNAFDRRTRVRNA